MSEMKVSLKKLI